MRLLQSTPSAAATALFCAVVFLSTVSLGASLIPGSIDSTWSAVLGWAFLRHVQWGSDLVFPYGPLGFSRSGAAFVPGILPWLIIAQVIAAAGFAAAAGMLFRRITVVDGVLFGLVMLCWSSRISGDAASVLTLLFGAAFAIDQFRDLPDRWFASCIAALALVLGGLALTKFSFFAVWALCVVAVTAYYMLRREAQRVAICLLCFTAAPVAIWVACRQDIRNLPKFLERSNELSVGHAHAMGQAAPPIIQSASIAALFVVAVFGLWTLRGSRGDVHGKVLVPLVFGTCVLIWFACFSRGDAAHWPYFFPVVALVPFVLLAPNEARLEWTRRAVVVGISALGLVAMSIQNPNAAPLEEVPGAALIRLGDNLRSLLNLDAVRSNREEDWARNARIYDLPMARAVVGSATVDALGSQQSFVLLNQMNYAPRPVFQSYIAYTPVLSRLNESYFLGSTAPSYVLLPFDPIDNRLPMSEDGLARLTLLQEYHPVLIEKQLLLLERNLSTAPGKPTVEENADRVQASLGESVPLRRTAGASVIFIHIELSTFGRIYTAIYREPQLRMTLRGAKGIFGQYRLVRATAAVGFLVSPLLRSPDDWVALDSGKVDTLDNVESIAIDAASPSERPIFGPRILICVQPINLRTHREVRTSDPDQK